MGHYDTVMRVLASVLQVGGPYVVVYSTVVVEGSKSRDTVTSLNTRLQNKQSTIPTPPSCSLSLPPPLTLRPLLPWLTASILPIFLVSSPGILSHVSLVQQRQTLCRYSRRRKLRHKGTKPDVPRRVGRMLMTVRMFSGVFLVELRWRGVSQQFVF